MKELGSENGVATSEPLQDGDFSLDDDTECRDDKDANALDNHPLGNQLIVNSIYKKTAKRSFVYQIFV